MPAQRAHESLLPNLFSLPKEMRGAAAQPLPPEIESYFAAQSKIQQSHVKVAHIQKNVKETIIKMEEVMEKVGERGIQINESAEGAQQLLDSSEEFLNQTRRGGWCAWIPEWWCNGTDERAAPARQSHRKRK